MIFTSWFTPLWPSLLLITSSWLLNSSHFSKHLVSPFLSLSVTSDWQFPHPLFLYFFLYLKPEIFSRFWVSSTVPQKYCKVFLQNWISIHIYISFIYIFLLYICDWHIYISFVIDNLCSFSNQSADSFKSTVVLRQFLQKQLITCWPTLPILR